MEKDRDTYRQEGLVQKLVSWSYLVLPTFREEEPYIMLLHKRCN